MRSTKKNAIAMPAATARHAPNESCPELVQVLQKPHPGFATLAFRFFRRQV
jgi:hypothetical protein